MNARQILFLAGALVVLYLAMFVAPRVPIAVTVWQVLCAMIAGTWEAIVFFLTGRGWR